MRKFLNRRNGVLLAAALIVVAFSSFESGSDRNFQIVKNLDTFNSIVKGLGIFYVGAFDPNKTAHEGINHILSSLDPYTGYYPGDDQAELQQMLNVSFGGIGSLIMYNQKLRRSMITEPFKGTPTAKIGLEAGDILMEIDGRDPAGKNNQEVSQMFRGAVDTSFKLKVERPDEKGDTRPLEFNIVRQTIQTPTVPYDAALNRNVGCISLGTFSGTPSKDFKKTSLRLKKEGITSSVINLCGDGGGRLEEAVEITNFFLPCGKVIVTTRGETKQIGDMYKTSREPLDLNIPITVLVNRGAASVSEIPSEAFQNFDHTVIVGNHTFGRGLVQTARPLPYGGVVRPTISKYYIPSGRYVQAIDYKHRNKDDNVGIIPDSLTTVFHTAAGRKARSGGDVIPDIGVKQEGLPNILFYLMRDSPIFDYVTQYCLKHPSIPSPQEFKVTGADYNDFKTMMKKVDFKYDQQSERIIKILEEAAELEGYLDEASEKIKALEKKLTHNLDRDLDYFPKSIKSMIANEIIKRHYYTRGGIIQQLKDDDRLQAALKILVGPIRYKEALSASIKK